MSKTIKISYVALVVSIVGLLATTVYANHAWGKYHWNLSTQDTIDNPLKLGNNLTSVDWDSSLNLAAVDWNQSVIKNQIVAGAGQTNCDPVLGQVEVCNGEYGNNGWLGIAQIWTYRGKEAHIAQAVTMMNDTYFNLPQYNTSAWKNMVMCQEVGHTFGLAHQDEDFYNLNLGSCMDYTSDPTGILGTNGTLNNERPNQHDYDELQLIYAHLNDTTSGGSKPGKGSGGKKRLGSTTVNPAEWGQAIAQDAQGKNSVYVRNLDNGMQLITHVLWVPGEEQDHH